MKVFVVLLPPSGQTREGAWLAVVYGDHWWLAKAMDEGREHQDGRVEFMHECI